MLRFSRQPHHVCSWYGSPERTKTRIKQFCTQNLTMAPVSRGPSRRTPSPRLRRACRALNARLLIHVRLLIHPHFSAWPPVHRTTKESIVSPLNGHLRSRHKSLNLKDGTSRRLASVLSGTVPGISISSSQTTKK